MSYNQAHALYRKYLQHVVDGNPVRAWCYKLILKHSYPDE